MSTLKWTVGTAAVILLVAAPALAQRRGQAQPNAPAQPRQQQFQQQQPQQQPQQRTTLRPVQGQESAADHEIAAWQVVCNEMEAQLSQWAQNNIQDAKLKQFAEKMSQQHAAFANQLRQFAPDAPRITGQVRQQRTGQFEQEQQQLPPRQVPRAIQQQEQAPPQPVTRQAQTGSQQQFQPGQPGQGLNMNQVGHEIAERSLAAIKQELERKKGPDFDKCFAGVQVFQHINSLSALETLRPHASQQLGALIDQGIQETKQHLQEIRQIADDLSGSREQRTGAREKNLD